MEFTGKTALVTGGAKGIGKAVALALAKRGANIVVADIDMRFAPGIETEAKSAGCDCLVFKTNVSIRKDVHEMIQKIIEKFNRIDILVNSAGIVSESLIIDTEEKDWDAVLEVNLKGVFICCQAVAKEMIKQRSGKIINISSMAGKTGPSREGAYAASKSAVITLTKTLAQELAPYGINVNAVCPGLIETDMFKKVCEGVAALKGISVEELMETFVSRIPLDRIGKPEEVADLILFLASEEANYITGESVNITGGYPAI